MRIRLAAILIPLVLALPIALLTPQAQASPSEEYSGTHFGDENLPAGCVKDMSPNNPDNICHHMRTGLNGLDSPQVDVLVMVPVSPTAERDMRIMRQSVEMWESGIDFLAEEMGLDWLADGVDFHITVQYLDPHDGSMGEFTTYPIVDPEIVIIASNPVGGIGIGIDPLTTVFGEDVAPCTGLANPFAFDAWDAIPGFDNHHERSGTYTEDCDGAGGDICFAVNGAIDPAPEAIDFFGLFDLVSHEFGHCLTLGHVGDGAEGEWAVTPTNDIMAYHSDPPGLTKCVSTLDVEVFATRMSKYLDVNGDGVVDAADTLLVNDQAGDRDDNGGGQAFHVQHPSDHLYASGTGSPMDCPQPDLGLLPGERTEWTPTPVDTVDERLVVASPTEGTSSTEGLFTVAGSVEKVARDQGVEDPTETSGSVDDADDDASSPITEITSFDVEVTDTAILATIDLAQLWPTTAVVSPTSYSLVIDGNKFDSFIRYAVDPNPMTWDNGAGAYLPAGASTWDLDASTVSFTIPRSYLADKAITAPYQVSSAANFGVLSTAVEDDTAPDDGESIGLAGARTVGLGVPVTNAGIVSFEHPGGNHFDVEDTNFGDPAILIEAGTHHEFSLHIPETSDVTFTLDWTDVTGNSDLDLYVEGAATGGSEGATTAIPETIVLEGVQGYLDITVNPYLILDPVDGVTYELTADITPLAEGADSDGDGIADRVDVCPATPGVAPSGCPDEDGDGVPDADDVCPGEPGEGADGCPVAPTEFVHLYIDGVFANSQPVDSANGPDSFSIPAEVSEGEHELRIDWEDRGKVIASETVNVVHVADDDNDGVSNVDDRCPGFDDNEDLDNDGIPDDCDPRPGRDRDGDGVADKQDNCKSKKNRLQTDMDGDGQGDACDKDIDGDGHSNDKEIKYGTDPRDPSSYPKGTAANG